MESLNSLILWLFRVGRVGFYSVGITLAHAFGILNTNSLHAQANEGMVWRVGGSSEIFQTRFQSREDSQFSGFWIEGESENWSGILESRGDRTLGSLQYRNDFIKLTGGHRYKSVPGFFLGRDPNIFSTLTEHQPIERSYSLSLLPGYLSPGVFWMESITGKNRPGYSIVFPENTLALTYSVDTGIRSFYTNVREAKLRDPWGVLPNLYFTAQGEAIGTPQNYFGRYFLRLKEREWDGFQWESRFYKDNNGELFESPDNFLERFTEEPSSTENPFVSWTAIQWSPWYRLEGFDSVGGGERFRYGGVRLGLIPLPGGRIAMRHRTYEERLDAEDETIIQRVPGNSLLWIGASRNYTYSIGREFRSNGDRITETGLDWRGDGWTLRSSLLFQKEGNLLRTPIERYTGMDRPDASLTDRKTVLRLRFKTKFLDWNITSSERMGRRGSLIFMNIQFMYEF